MEYEKETEEKDTYLLVIHGIAPELWGAVAFRKAAGFTIERQKVIKCPYCGKRLTAVDNSTKLEMYRYPKKAEINCHEYRKCGACGETVGLVFIS